MEPHTERFPGSTIFLQELVWSILRSFVADEMRLHAVPPRRARTRCSVAPPSRLYSAAVLSSLLQQIVSRERAGIRRSYAHLLAAEDQTLLNRGNAFLLFDTLLYARDL